MHALKLKEYAMGLDLVQTGKDVPNEVNVII
ncbi:MAG: hypothetical protein RI923_1286, partial [Pseudomonadota bacterium]